jgi:hypothetical protein
MARQASFYRRNQTLAKIIRIGLRHSCWPPFQHIP